MKATLYNRTRPTLSCQVQEALRSQYTRKAGHQSLSKLSQGETDVLHQAREMLGWPTITSLAHKYYQLYPNRQWWKRALERCSRQKVRTVTLNIRYLLLTLETVKAMALNAAFTGKGELNRLVHCTNNSINEGIHRLVPQGGIVNAPSLDKRPYTLVRWFHANEEYDNSVQQDVQLACAAAR